MKRLSDPLSDQVAPGRVVHQRRVIDDLHPAVVGTSKVRKDVLRSLIPGLFLEILPPLPRGRCLGFAHEDFGAQMRIPDLKGSHARIPVHVFSIGRDERAGGV